MVFYMDPGRAEIVLKGETITRDKTFGIVRIWTIPEHKDIISFSVHRALIMSRKYNKKQCYIST